MRNNATEKVSYYISQSPYYLFQILLILFILYEQQIIQLVLQDASAVAPVQRLQKILFEISLHKAIDLMWLWNFLSYTICRKSLCIFVFKRFLSKIWQLKFSSYLVFRKFHQAEYFKFIYKHHICIVTTICIVNALFMPPVSARISKGGKKTGLFRGINRFFWKGNFEYFRKLLGI